MVDFQVGEGPDDASKKRFSWFPDWIAKAHMNVNLIDLVKSSMLQNLASMHLRTCPLKFAKR